MNRQRIFRAVLIEINSSRHCTSTSIQKFIENFPLINNNISRRLCTSNCKDLSYRLKTTAEHCQGNDNPAPAASSIGGYFVCCLFPDRATTVRLLLKPREYYNFFRNDRKLLKITANSTFCQHAACCSTVSGTGSGSGGDGTGNSASSKNSATATKNGGGKKPVLSGFGGSLSSSSSSIDDLKGSDVLNRSKPVAAKPVIKVVPSAPKVSEMSGDKRKSMMNRSSKLITALRAMNEYCLTERHLEALPKFERRSAYFGELPQIMYIEADVERLAIEVHGSKAQQRRLSYESALKLQSKNLFSNIPHPSQFKSKERRMEAERMTKPVWEGPALVVLCAVGVNALNATMKFIMWFYTGSHCMFAEGIHSLADTLNQIILAIGIHQSAKRADPLHPYGYSNLRHVTSLISGVGIFFLGTGLSMYHGIQGLFSHEELQPLFWSFVTLAISLVTEGGTLYFAYTSINKKAKAHNMTIGEYVWEGEDPGLNVVLLEDCASVLGVTIAATSLGISQYFNSTVPDAVGSLVIGGLLGVVASFIIYSNSVHLVGKSMPQTEVIEIVRNLENDAVVRSVQDVKTTELGGQQTRFKAEVDLDGYIMTKAYLKSQDLTKLLQEVKSLETEEDMERFLLFHGEQIVDRVGAEIDRIEQDLKVKHPDLRHVDLEVL